MPGANFPRLKNWTSTEDVTAADLNAEFDNILNNLTAANVDDFSANVSQMQSSTDPGEVGSESLATSVAGEIQRIRFLLTEITGSEEWYESPVSSILGLANAIGTGLTANRIVSGKVRSTSQQPLFLIPNGAARTVTVAGTATNFIYYVNGIEYTILADTALTGLTAAPAANNTCSVNDALATGGQDWTRHAGEEGTSITVDSMGTEITGLVGKFAAFRLAGAATEYFIAYVNSTTSLTKAMRGFFFDSSDAPVVRTTFTDNDTITLMKLTWIFAKIDRTLTATYNPPIWSDDEPTSPSLGDYWFDTSANTWKVYGVGSYSPADAVLIGVCIQDTTNTVAARSFEFFKGYTELNTVELAPESNTQVKSRFQGSQCSVNGVVVKNERNLHTWDMTLDLESGVTEAASTPYYFYLTETGDKIISNKRPFDRREDLLGYYHPHNSWRCVGYAFNNASSHLEQVESYFKRYDFEPMRSVISTDVQLMRDRSVTFTGASFTYTLLPAAQTKGMTFTLIHGGTSQTQVYTVDGSGAELIGGLSSRTLYDNGEVWVIRSNGTGYDIISEVNRSDVELYLDTPNGHGSTNTFIRRYTNSRKNTLGVYATYADSATLGMTVTINVPGLYQASITDGRVAGSSICGISLNTSAPTTTITSVTYAQGKRAVGAGDAAGIILASVTLRLVAGDIVRAHTGNAADLATDNGTFRLIRIAP